MSHLIFKLYTSIRDMALILFIILLRIPARVKVKQPMQTQLQYLPIVETRL